MGERTSIQWCEATWNPTRGCSRVSEGCRHCYAERVAARLSGPGQPYEGLARFTGRNGVRDARWSGRLRLAESVLDLPLHWRRPRRVFVNSMSDLFHEKVRDEWIDRVFAVMALAPRHTFQVLTKRPERMLAYLTTHAAGGRHVWTAAQAVTMPRGRVKSDPGWPLPNVWVGVSVEDQATADARIRPLLETPAAVRFISYEPALGPVDLRTFVGSSPAVRLCGYPVLDWVIVGGESGPGARPFDLAWARQAIAQCQAAGVPVFFKQAGSRPLLDGAPLRLRDHKGGSMEEWPADVRVREYPGEVRT